MTNPCPGVQKGPRGNATAQPPTKRFAADCSQRMAVELAHEDRKDWPTDATLATHYGQDKYGQCAESQTTLQQVNATASTDPKFPLKRLNVTGRERSKKKGLEKAVANRRRPQGFDKGESQPRRRQFRHALIYYKGGTSSIACDDVMRRAQGP